MAAEILIECPWDGLPEERPPLYFLSAHSVLCPNFEVLCLPLSASVLGAMNSTMQEDQSRAGAKKHGGHYE